MDENKDRKESVRQKMLEQQKEAKIARRIVFTISAVVLLLIVVIAGGGYLYIQSALKPVNPDSKVEKKIDIPIGSSVSGISQILENKGIIKNAKVFKYYVKFKNESGFMAGEYTLSPSMTIPKIIENLKTGTVSKEVTLKITLPEGIQLQQIAEIIAKKTNQNTEIVFKTLNDPSFIKPIMEKYPDILTDEILAKNIKYPLEGYLFPATYSFYTENPSLEEMVTEMLEKTKESIDPYMVDMEEKGFTPHKLLTMASLIEEEASEQVDRHKISSVFYNRIEKGMPLQTDPTVLYAQGKHKEKVYYKDLEVDSPYNTYKVTGLPPSPIANAGVMSIEAALFPEETDFLFFLANAEGEVLFSKTLEEHNEKKAEHITNK
ncbi:endolytic transglycosylase MltG [Bacillus sp. CGMCC 1.16607]|uniref:endolytic transglycosylase MltG n=1 Tax=Bacillus sp. CGMCC 1.16607 TaxID=3351842 RepID=UPI00362DE0CD